MVLYEHGVNKVHEWEQIYSLVVFQHIISTQHHLSVCQQISCVLMSSIRTVVMDGAAVLTLCDDRMAFAISLKLCFSVTVSYILCQVCWASNHYFLYCNIDGACPRVEHEETLQ